MTRETKVEEFILSFVAADFTGVAHSLERRKTANIITKLATTVPTNSPAKAANVLQSVISSWGT